MAPLIALLMASDGASDGSAQDIPAPLVNATPAAKLWADAADREKKTRARNLLGSGSRMVEHLLPDGRRAVTMTFIVSSEYGGSLPVWIINGGSPKEIMAMMANLSRHLGIELLEESVTVSQLQRSDTSKPPSMRTTAVPDEDPSHSAFWSPTLCVCTFKGGGHRTFSKFGHETPLSSLKAPLLPPAGADGWQGCTRRAS